jgi:thiol-disulfide isomerase/thioredoxin
MALVFGILVMLPGGAQPADGDGLAGTWKVTVLNQDRPTYFLINLENKSGSWTGKIVDTAQGVPPARVDDVKVANDRMRISLKVQNQTLTFEGKTPPAKADKILGSLDLGGQLAPAQLEATKMTSLKDPYEASKEVLAKQPDSPEAFDAAIEMLKMATVKKAKPDEIRGWANRAFKNAESYGPRWQRHMGMRIAEVLVAQEGLAPIAVEYARRTERLLEPTDEASIQVRVLEALAAALTKTNKADEAKEILARVDKLELKADQEFLKRVPPLTPDKYQGRKKKSDRVVLVELFTGAQCPPCVAADLAFDALEKTYKPAEVILLEYHVHIPGPDPLTNPDAEARMAFYGREIEGTPTILFNGKSEAGGGGPISNAKNKYKEYREVIDPLLETPPKAKLKATAVRKGDRIDISAEVSELDKASDSNRLRLALVEEQVRYTGGNQMRFHHRVVRALPGGAKGLAITGRSARQSLTVDLGELRKSLSKYLDDFSKEQEFLDAKRPLELKQLSLVAFVQNDDNKEVLQAVEVALGTEAGGS